MTYTELHCHSHWSLLDGASSPLELVLRARDTWRIDDEWWRERAVSRLYFKVLYSFSIARPPVSEVYCAAATGKMRWEGT